MQGFMLNTHLATQKAMMCLSQNPKKSAVKNSIEKPISLNFVKLSTIFCPSLWDLDCDRIVVQPEKQNSKSISELGPGTPHAEH